MDEFRRLFTFGKGERVAIISILTVLLLSILACIFLPFKKEPPEYAYHNLDSLIQVRENALQEAEAQKQEARMPQQSRLTPFPFNPNEMNEEDWHRLGLTERQIRMIGNYQAKGGTFYSKADFKRLYCINDEEYETLAPYIIIPASEGKRKTYSEKGFNSTNASINDSVSFEKKKIDIVAVNSSDSSMLSVIPRVGPYLASRIVAYRERLGGFVELEQLLEVKGMDESRFESIGHYLSFDETDVKKIDVNRDEFKAILAHPYFTYDMVKAVVRYRESRGFIKNWEQLETVLTDFQPLNHNLKYYIKY